ncbi:MAG TPA: thioredoxin family protein [Levilinea sp.]|nr:thioredoxin family protein [Levilinea sp.]
MHPELISRLLWAVLILLSGVALYWLYNRVTLRRLASQRPPGLESLRPDTPAILYFTTPECAPCKTIQRPALQHLQQKLGGRLQVIEINAAEKPDLAGAWGVLSVPTTFVLDPQGRPRHVNHGVTTAEKLLQQLAK